VYAQHGEGCGFTAKAHQLVPIQCSVCMPDKARVVASTMLVGPENTTGMCMRDCVSLKMSGRDAADIGKEPLYQAIIFVQLAGDSLLIDRVNHNHIYGQNSIYIYMCGVYSVFLAGKIPNIRSYMVHVYGSGQPYSLTVN